MITKNLMPYEKWRLKKIGGLILFIHLLAALLCFCIFGFLKADNTNWGGPIAVCTVLMMFCMGPLADGLNIFRIGYIQYSEYAKNVLSYNEKAISAHRKLSEQMQRGIDLNFSKDLTEQYSRAMRVKDDGFDQAKELTADEQLDNIINHLQTHKGPIGN